MSIIHPATVIVSGGTGSGKSSFTRSLIAHHEQTFMGLTSTPKVVWCNGSETADKLALGDVQIRYVDYLIDESTLRSSKVDILVVDDMMTEKSNDGFMHNLFTKHSHHLKVTVIYITQNLYEKGQCKMKRNAHYLIMMRNPSDKSQLTTLGRQLYPRHKELLNHFYESYDDATSVRYGYLFIDVSPNGDERQKLKTNILPDKSGKVRVVVYIPRT